MKAATQMILNKYGLFLTTLFPDAIAIGMAESKIRPCKICKALAGDTTIFAAAALTRRGDDTDVLFMLVGVTVVSGGTI